VGGRGRVAELVSPTNSLTISEMNSSGTPGLEPARLGQCSGMTPLSRQLEL